MRGGRPVADRPQPALESGDLHRGVRPDPRSCSPSCRFPNNAATAPGRFSFNAAGGRCERCQGNGRLKIEMHFLPDAWVTCPACGGRRFNRETLEVTYKGKSIADVLELPVERGAGVFPADPEARTGFSRFSGGTRPRLSAARPGRQHALRRRGAAAEARGRTRAAARRRTRSISSTSRPPACTSATSSAVGRVPPPARRRATACWSWSIIST